MADGAIRPAGDAVHVKGCKDRGDAVPSQVLDGWTFCPGCRRVVAPATMTGGEAR